MEVEARVQNTPWRWPLLLSVIFLNVCLPSLVLCYGVFLEHAVGLGQPLWLGLATPAAFILTYGLTQCWCREAADSWGGPIGYRLMASCGLILVVTSLLASTFTPYQWHPLVYGALGGLGSSLIAAQVDAVVFETYDSQLGIVRGLCFIGQAFGQAIFPHIISALINGYGFEYSYILFAGIILQTLPPIMLLRVDKTVRRPTSYSRYGDASYALFGNGDANHYATELQLHDMSKKFWKSPSDDNLHTDDDGINEGYDNDVNVTITPPPSPEEKRRNIFGVEILPEIPEESEESDDYDDLYTPDKNVHKKRLSLAIKRLSIMGDNLSDYISKQVRRDSQSSQRRDSESSQGENREYSEVEVTYENITPITDIHREKIFNSFSFRCQSAYASLRRKIWMPSYRVYRLRRRLLYSVYSLNDTFIKPLTRSLSSWKFYPALLLCFTKLGLTAVSLVLLPMIASKMQPKISLSEANFLMTLHAFTWMCFLLCTPWLAQTPKRNFKYVAVIGLVISTGACFLIAEATNHDMFSIGCVVAGLGYGAVTSCWETAVQDFLGARKWPKLHSPLETLSATILAAFVAGLSFLVSQDGGLQFSMFILGIILSAVTFVWIVLSAVSIYETKIRLLRFGRRCFF